MKKQIIIAGFLLLFSLSAVSQAFQGGITGGLNASRIDGDGHELWGKLGLNAGAFVSREILQDRLYWQMELKYTSRGKYQGVTINTPGIEIIDLKYIEIPLSLNYFFNEKIFIEVGFAPDIFLKERYYDENGLIPNDEPIYDPDKLIHLGLTAFGSVNYKVLESLSFGIRFNYSVFPFYKFDAYSVRYRDSGLFHDVLSINAKYYLVK